MTGQVHKQRPYKRVSAPDRICRDCGLPIEDATVTSLRVTKCRRCYNLYFREWVFKRAVEGKLTGKRAKMNASPERPAVGADGIDYSRVLAWKVAA